MFLRFATSLIGTKQKILTIAFSSSTVILVLVVVWIGGFTVSNKYKQSTVLAKGKDWNWLASRISPLCCHLRSPLKQLDFRRCCCCCCCCYYTLVAASQHVLYPSRNHSILNLYGNLIWTTLRYLPYLLFFNVNPYPLLLSSTITNDNLPYSYY